jgi:hypothetical protein
VVEGVDGLAVGRDHHGLGDLAGSIPRVVEGGGTRALIILTGLVSLMSGIVLASRPDVGAQSPPPRCSAHRATRRGALPGRATDRRIRRAGAKSSLARDHGPLRSVRCGLGGLRGQRLTPTRKADSGADAPPCRNGQYAHRGSHAVLGSQKYLVGVRRQHYEMKRLQLLTRCDRVGVTFLPFCCSSER